MLGTEIGEKNYHSLYWLLYTNIVAPIAVADVLSVIAVATVVSLYYSDHKCKCYENILS